MAKHKIVDDIYNYVKQRHVSQRVFWIAYILVVILQVSWFTIAFYVGGEGEGIRGFVGSVLITSVTNIFGLIALVLVNLAVMGWLINRKGLNADRVAQEKLDISTCDDLPTSTQRLPDKWDKHHGNNTYILTYESRDKAVYEKHVEVIPQVSNLRTFRDGTYTWTGDEKKGPRIVESTCSLILRDVFLKKVYFVHLDMYTIIEKDKPFKYTVHADLDDPKNEAKPVSSHTVRCPTLSITFIVRMHKDVSTNDCYKAVALEEYGENMPFINETPHVTKDGDYHVYSYRFDNPKLFCEYGIMWGWVSSE